VKEMSFKSGVKGGGRDSGVEYITCLTQGSIMNVICVQTLVSWMFLQCFLAFAVSELRGMDTVISSVRRSERGCLGTDVLQQQFQQWQ